MGSPGREVSAPRRTLALFALFALTACATPPQPVKTTSGIVTKTIEHQGAQHRYAVYVPPGYDAASAWPLVVFLHGMGECGSDGTEQTTVGIGPAILARPDEWPCVVLMPQKPIPRAEWEAYATLVMAQLTATLQEYSIDRQRIALTGLSQGGHGAYVLGAQESSLWSCVAPICGYANPKPLAQSLAALPLWAFHGEADPTVPVAQTKAMHEAIVKAGGQPKLTLYPGVGHNSWDRAYRTEGLAKWLLVQRAPPSRPSRF